MKLVFILILLSGAASIVTSVFRKYYLIQNNKTWSDAQSYCRATYTDLATIETSIEMHLLQNEVQKQNLTSSLWIGLRRDIDSWYWSLDNSPLGSVTYWANGEPNSEAEECAAIIGGSWCDIVCSRQYDFVCFDSSKTGTDMYKLNTVAMNWFDAQKYCRSFHTDLVSIRNASELNIVKGLNSSRMWIGLYRGRSWNWSDQTITSNISWNPGEPDVTLAFGFCGYLNGQIGNAVCGNTNYFICCKVITMLKQLLRFKIESNQDVNVPEVKAAILEQIRQKLERLGLAENIMLKWREQPDGVTFKKINN